MLALIKCSVRHHQLEHMTRKIQQLEQKNKETRLKVQAYHDLPLDKDLATLQLEHLKRKLANLSSEFDEAIAKMV